MRSRSTGRHGGPDPARKISQPRPPQYITRHPTAPPGGVRPRAEDVGPSREQIVSPAVRFRPLIHEHILSFAEFQIAALVFILVPEIIRRRHVFFHRLQKIARDPAPRLLGHLAPHRTANFPGRGIRAQTEGVQFPGEAILHFTDSVCAAENEDDIALTKLQISTLVLLSRVIIHRQEEVRRGRHVVEADGQAVVLAELAAAKVPKVFLSLFRRLAPGGFRAEAGQSNPIWARGLRYYSE